MSVAHNQNIIADIRTSASHMYGAGDVAIIYNILFGVDAEWNNMEHRFWAATYYSQPVFVPTNASRSNLLRRACILNLHHVAVLRFLARSTFRCDVFKTVALLLQSAFC